MDLFKSSSLRIGLIVIHSLHVDAVVLGVGADELEDPCGGSLFKQCQSE